MGIKSDQWIKRMALEQGMIDPFVEGQMREGVISYGLSSYGYDIRVADEFKIFTNVNSAIVDPKHFDPRSLVDFRGDVCIVPPNSFALARTIEYFRIPRNVLTICLGKSTYARCFSADTRVALVDGSAPTLQQMARRAEDGEQFWGYSIGPAGRLIVTLLDRPRLIGQDALLEVTLDNGARIRCTPDHGFLLRAGRIAEAHDLRPGDSLMALDRQLVRGVETVYQPSSGHLLPIQRLADEWGLRNGIYADRPATHRQQRDYDRPNTRPWVIERVPAAEPMRHHNAENYGADFDAAERREHQAAAMRRFSGSPAEREAYALDETSSIGSAAHLLERERSSFRRFPEHAHAFGGKQRSHKVVAIRELAGDHDVYCLTVPEAGNFALDAGVFVKNCGIIVNVTPFEPEWEGYVTLEISNTTPLPAKIYANEGIAQVLFFEGDEPPLVSYKDKKGKYQGQHGVTLPRL